MKHLLLLRHAQAGSDLGVEDHERPLTDRGRLHALRLGERLAVGEVHPTLALCSSARRAQQTLEAILGRLRPIPAFELDRGLYLADAGTLLERVSEVDEGVGNLLLVGHNPAIANLLRRLAVSGEADVLSRLDRGVPAGTLATLRLEQGGWADLAPGRFRLIDLVVPQDPG